MVGYEQAAGSALGPATDEAYVRLHQRTPTENLEGRMKFEVALSAEANSASSDHLLQHYRRNDLQEDLCFGLWRPSTGNQRYTALVYEILLPQKGERLLHGNASFQPNYLARAINTARQRQAGVAFMHSHPGPGWQSMSDADVEAERDVLAYPAGATGFPLVGLTIGSDGYWSSRFWQRDGKGMRRNSCAKTRVVSSKSYQIYFNDQVEPPPERKEVLRRTFDTWGRDVQSTIARLRVGIVGLGSVGSIVAEAVARIGVTRITLIDPDEVEEHNLDRLLYATTRDIGKQKVQIASEAIRLNATADSVDIIALPKSIHDKEAYSAALDCDVIFSCVDRPLPRDVLNYIAQAHMIPVIDGGVSVETDTSKDKLFSAHWRAHLVTPFHQCLRCSGQYNSSNVVMELDGSLSDPSYTSNLPESERNRNQNVFPFSLSVAAMEVNLMIRYILSPDWWPLVQQQDYQFVTADLRTINMQCEAHCSFREHRMQGDRVAPFYLQEPTPMSTRPRGGFARLIAKVLGKVFSRS